MADLIICTYCEEEITGVHIQCCECQDFGICLQCFVCGAEIGQHKNDHSYKFVEHWSINIFGGRGNWTGCEELKLLDAVELYGLSNWGLVSQDVETRTPEECKEEYISRYLDGNIGKATWAKAKSKEPSVIDHGIDDSGPFSSAAISKLAPLDIRPEEAQELGYKSHRDSYEREYDIEAEQLVSPLKLDDTDDTNIEIALKLSIVDMYIRRIRERARRKRIVRDYQLVAKFFEFKREDVIRKQLTKEQKELRENMKVFAQLLVSTEHERLIINLEQEKELRFRLSELYRYRSWGLTTQEEVFHYEQHVAFQKQQQVKQNKSGSSGSPTSIQECLSKNGKNDENLNTFEKRFMWPQCGEQENGSNNSANLNMPNLQQLTASPQPLSQSSPAEAPPLSLTSLSPTSFTSPPQQPPPLEALPLGSLLSKNEIKLCKNLNIYPVQYITLKTLIIQEHMNSPNKLSNENNTNSSQELSVKDAIIKYLSCSGWLPDVQVV